MLLKYEWKQFIPQANIFYFFYKNKTYRKVKNMQRHNGGFLTAFKL